MQLYKKTFVFNIRKGKELDINYADIHKDIIEQSKQGNQKAQFQLYKLYAKAMFNISFRMLNNREEAEDVLQIAFCDAFKRLESFRYESSFGAWLKRIVVNKCINHLKSRKIDLVLYDDLFKINQKEEIHEETDVELNVQKIYKAMDKLADGYRVIFSLYSIEGYDHSEIAQILGVTESTSKSQYLRAKRKLQEILGAVK